MPDMHNFATVSGAPRRRSTFLLPYRHSGTINEGALYPFYCQEVLPGDTFDVRHDFTIRNLRTPYVPALNDAYVDKFYFYVPFRILWGLYESFTGVAEPDEYTTPSDKIIPKIDLSSYPVAPGSVLNGLGLPVGYRGQVSMMPLAGYVKIVNDWFRDENVQASSPLEGIFRNGTSGQVFNYGYFAYYSTSVAGFNEQTSAAKYHDLFTSCLPGIKGGSTALPLGSTAPLKATGKGNISMLNADSLSNIEAGSGIFTNATITPSSTNAVFYGKDANNDPVSARLVLDNGTLVNAGAYADLSQATAATVNQLRLAIAAQLYKEQITRSGSRFTEILRALWGVSPSDARLQRPEFLGGYHGLLHTQQVANTSGNASATSSQTTDKATGGMGAYSLTNGSTNTFIKSFEEPGMVIGLMCIRVKHRYSQGIPKIFKKTGKFDFFLPQFDRIGEVPVPMDEIYWSGTGTFGFQEAWYEYRHTPDFISGEITPGVSTDLQAWTYGDNFPAAPTLNSAFIKEDKGRIDQNMSGSTSVAQFAFDIQVMNKATRPMSLNSVPSSFGL